jgi:hypothetical protein
VLSQVDVATPVVDALSESAIKVQWVLTAVVPLVVADVDGVVDGVVALVPAPPHAASNVARRDDVRLVKIILFIYLM